jgi:hypothetical protein
MDAPHNGDLLEKAGKIWKANAKNNPGGRFFDATRGNQVRKHVPLFEFQECPD